MPEAADGRAFIFRASAWAASSITHKPWLLGDVHDRAHVGGQAEQMDGEDRLGVRGDGAGDGVGFDVVGAWIDVHEHGRRAQPGHTAGGGKECKGRGDDLIARADAHGHHRQQQRIGAGGDADGVPGLAAFGQLVLELLGERAENKLAGIHNTVKGLAQLGQQVLVLLLKVDQGYSHGWYS